MSIPPCYSQSPLLTDFTPPPPPPPPEQKWFETVNIAYVNLMSENSAQKPQQNCTFMNSASGFGSKIVVPGSYLEGRQSPRQVEIRTSENLAGGRSATLGTHHVYATPLKK
jgi:hypothetical protein